MFLECLSEHGPLGVVLKDGTFEKLSLWEVMRSQGHAIERN